MKTGRKRPDQSLRLMIRNTIHGMSGSPTHRSWSAMLTRCLNPRTSDYKNYGGRGITICDRWISFPEFMADMGIRPAGHSLGRINPNGNYEPNNCRWETSAQQALSRRNTVFVEWKGERRPLMEWAAALGLSYSMLQQRIDDGWDVEQAFTLPPGTKRPHFVHYQRAKTHCKRGHALAGENLRVNKRGFRSCKECQRQLQRRMASA